jgi:hypothetical protein
VMDWTWFVAGLAVGLTAGLWLGLWLWADE